MRPDPNKALELLEATLKEVLRTFKADVYELIPVIERAIGHIKGYNPDLTDYKCSCCGVTGVKLWRQSYTASPGWCSKCGTAQAGREDTVDEDGRILRVDELDGTELHGDKIDQIYGWKQGKGLLPWVPREDGETWGYGHVPPEGVLWWRTLPTRKETS